MPLMSCLGIGAKLGELWKNPERSPLARWNKEEDPLEATEEIICKILSYVYKVISQIMTVLVYIKIPGGE